MPILRSLVLKIGEKVHLSAHCTLLILDSTVSDVELGICRDNQSMATEIIAYGNEYVLDAITIRPLKRLNNYIVRVFISAPQDFQTDFEMAKQKNTTADNTPPTPRIRQRQAKPKRNDGTTGDIRA